MLKREQGGLIYFKDGKWKPYISTLLTGQRVAHQEAEADPKKKFLADNTDVDLMHGYKLQSLRPGQKHSWFSSYAHEQEALHGKEFMRDSGQVPARKMGFIYQAVCLEDGSVLLSSQTVDGSDPDAFLAAMDEVGQNPEAGLDEMTAAYDYVMSSKYGGEFHAGRPGSKQENAWEAINRHKDLVEYHLNGLERLAKSSLPENWLKRDVEEHVYGVWAAFKKRLDGFVPRETTPSYGLSGFVHVPPEYLIRQEVGMAFREFSARGEVLTGCGGSIRMGSGAEDIFSADPADVFSAIFDKSSQEEDRYGSLTFNCPKGHKNRRPRNQLIDKCTTCQTSVKC